MTERLSRRAFEALADGLPEGLAEAFAQGAYARYRCERPSLPRWEDCTPTWRAKCMAEARWGIVAAQVAGATVSRPGGVSPPFAVELGRLAMAVAPLAPGAAEADRASVNWRVLRSVWLQMLAVLGLTEAEARAMAAANRAGALRAVLQRGSRDE